MDMLTRVGGVDPYHGGTSQQRPGTGAFARHKKQEEERRRREAETAATEAAPEVDPLLAEIDRLRVLDPNLTESGTHRALLAARAYHVGPPPVVDGEPSVAPDPVSEAVSAVDSAAGTEGAPAATSPATDSTRAFSRPPPATGSEPADR